ncbi:MAG: hypothetical protein CMH53_07990 [Myxococcales bacterium]|nr:hypothetical protein [Myxococcales bacterium]
MSYHGSKGVAIALLAVFSMWGCGTSAPSSTAIQLGGGMTGADAAVNNGSEDTTVSTAEDTQSGGASSDSSGSVADAGSSGQDGSSASDAGGQASNDAGAADAAGPDPKDTQGSGNTDAGASQGDASAAADSGASGGQDAGGGKDAGGAKPDAGQGGGGCVDLDKDGYGNGCVNGGDCDDNNPNFALICPDCAKANHPGCPCKGTAANCYTGDPQWIGKGICQAGVQLCQNGYWGTCNGEVLPTPEACDGKDNNCNALVDEGVLSSCGTCDMSCTQQKMGPDFGNPFSLDKTNANGVGLDANGYLKLDLKTANANLNHIWIAGTGEKTISKVNTKTGKEEGRYRSCSSPSRTSVDLNGDVWVGCRSGGEVMKIEVDETKCKDKNGNGKIDTSTDTNGDGKISTSEMLPYKQDECVRFVVKPNGSESVIRAVGVDKDNHAWVGGWGTKNLWRLEPANGAVVDTINIGCNPYGLVIDQKGVIWIAGRGCSELVRADPKTKAVSKHGNGGKGSPYGINVDMFGRLWIANTTNWSSRFDPVTNKWSPVSHNQRSRGIATSNDGYIYVALDQTSSVAKINAVTLVTEAHISLGSGRYPVGIAVDYDGYVWAVNQSKASASKVDPKTNSVVGEYPVGNSPYTYSDMTGYTLNNYTAPKGKYTHVFGFGGWSGTVAENKTKTLWESLDAEITVPPKGFVKLRYRAGDNLKDLDKLPWSAELGPFPPTKFPVDLTKAAKKVEGRFLQVEYFLQAGSNKLSPLIKSVTAKGKQVPAI